MGNEMEARNLICVVDDDPSMSRMLTRIISSLKLEVAAFSSAEEFLESGRVRESSCLILDVNLPGMSGIELQQKLNNDPQRVPVIFISGASDEPTRERALEKGPAAFFKKPFRIDAILKTIQDFHNWERWSLTGVH
jgi:FixJ family two-component response regulator